jgi:hypothetical protein
MRGLSTHVKYALFIVQVRRGPSSHLALLEALRCIVHRGPTGGSLGAFNSECGTQVPDLTTTAAAGATRTYQ